MLSEDEINNLIDSASRAREHAYAPYSGFRVGAALLGVSGRVYLGCNIENVSFGGTICAERAAVCAAVTAGEREFRAIAIKVSGSPVTPCGICRQVLAEFTKSGELTVICASDGGYKTTTLASLLPDAFDKFEPEGKKDV
jgi:cytidine deaminase